MFLVFEYSVFYPCCKYKIRKGISSSLPSPPPRRKTALQGPPQTLVPPRATAVSLHGRLVSETIYEGRDSFIFFTYFFKFFTYSFMFPTYFPHTPSWGHVIDLQQEIFQKFSKSLKSEGGGRKI